MMDKHADKSVFQEALNLAGLSFDWDKYGSAPVEQLAILSACEFLVEHVREDARKCATVVPVSHGGIQVEWHLQDADLEIEWNSRGEIIGVYRQGELSGLSKIDTEHPDTSQEIVMSQAIEAASEWPPPYSGL